MHSRESVVESGEPSANIYFSFFQQLFSTVHVATCLTQTGGKTVNMNMKFQLLTPMKFTLKYETFTLYLKTSH